jgi:hypothetical protein
VCGADDGGSDKADTGGSSSGDVGDAGAETSAGKPKVGELRLTFALTTSGGAATTCAANSSIASVAATLTAGNGGSATSTSFTCSDGKGTVSDIAFGDYELVVEALNASEQTLGHALPVDLTFAESPCDAIEGTACVKKVDVTIKLD